MRFLVIDGCPCPADVAPYVYIVLRDAGQAASSIYRGDDPVARPILHVHGKHTQRELRAAYDAGRGAALGITGRPNASGQSQHELRSDGRADAGPAGRALPTYRQGVDSGTNDRVSRDRTARAGAAHGWQIEHPYNAGVEEHHWCFRVRPKPHSLKMRARIIRLRLTLPRR